MVNKIKGNKIYYKKIQQLEFYWQLDKQCSEQ